MVLQGEWLHGRIPLSASFTFPALWLRHLLAQHFLLLSEYLHPPEVLTTAPHQPLAFSLPALSALAQLASCTCSPPPDRWGSSWRGDGRVGPSPLRSPPVGGALANPTLPPGKKCPAGRRPLPAPVEHRRDPRKALLSPPTQEVPGGRE